MPGMSREEAIGIGERLRISTGDLSSPKKRYEAKLAIEDEAFYVMERARAGDMTEKESREHRSALFAYLALVKEGARTPPLIIVLLYKLKQIRRELMDKSSETRFKLK